MFSKISKVFVNVIPPPASRNFFWEDTQKSPRTSLAQSFFKITLYINCWLAIEIFLMNLHRMRLLADLLLKLEVFNQVFFCKLGKNKLLTLLILKDYSVCSFYPQMKWTLDFSKMSCKGVGFIDFFVSAGANMSQSRLEIFQFK